MKVAIAVVALAGLMIAPIACAIVVCPELNTHDCCPKSKSFAPCPFDILSSAKASLPAVVAVVLTGFSVRIAPLSRIPALPAPADPRDLHLQHRVLRI